MSKINKLRTSIISSKCISLWANTANALSPGLHPKITSGAAQSANHHLFVHNHFRIPVVPEVSLYKNCYQTNPVESRYRFLKLVSSLLKQ
jgi:hypothetical protein